MQPAAWLARNVHGVDGHAAERFLEALRALVAGRTAEAGAPLA
jgi:hypothetical protein